MARDSLVDSMVGDLLTRIVSGDLPPGARVPPEPALAEAYEVSRLTVREAVRQLVAIAVVRVERGRGTTVNPVAEWTSVDAVVRAASARGTSREVSIQVLEMRRMIEVGAAELAGGRRTEDDVDRCRAHLEEMRAAHQRADVDAFVAADLAFHDVVLRSSGNLLVPALYDPVRRLLMDTRRETSAVPDIQRHAIERHEQILAALVAADPEGSRRAMAAHMVQTHDDLLTYVLDAPATG